MTPNNRSKCLLELLHDYANYRELAGVASGQAEVLARNQEEDDQELLAACRRGESAARRRATTILRRIERRLIGRTL